MLKYLRIAVTALSLSACVLLVALWVRSYRWTDSISRTGHGLRVLSSDFSLRTLLIATTLVAVGLGVIVAVN